MQDGYDCQIKVVTAVYKPVNEVYKISVAARCPDSGQSPEWFESLVQKQVSNLDESLAESQVETLTDRSGQEAGQA